MVNLLLTTFIFITFTQTSLALDAVIQVLEAPLYESPNVNSRISQFKRKGDIIKLHPSEIIENDFPEYESSNFSNLERDNDPLFERGKLYSPQPFYAFYKTISRNGKIAYVQKDYVKIFTKDARELDHINPTEDLTDYRLQEPLPKDYPLWRKTDTITQLQIITGIPNYSPYPYSSNIIDTEYAYIKEFQFLMANKKDVEKNNRFYFGFYGGVHISNINYLTNNYKAQQENIRISIGPLINYDLYKTKTRVFNIFTSIQYNVLDQMNITVAGDFAEKEVRAFYSFLSFTQTIGMSYQFLNVFYENDLFLGVSSRLHAPKVYQTSSSSSQEDYWGEKRGATSYTQAMRAEVNFFIGLQRDF